MSAIRSTLAKIGRPVIRAGLSPIVLSWRPYSRLLVIDDGAGWSLAWDAREVSRLADKLGVRLIDRRWRRGLQRQCIYCSDHFAVFSGRLHEGGNRVATSYFHGLPGTGVPEFDKAYEQLKKKRHEIHRLQVSHSQMRDVALSAGMEPSRVFTIPIGINHTLFPAQTPESREQARAALDIPRSAAVVGSFQKDGVGWAEGLEPKLIKGPDVFLKVIEILKSRIPDLFVLLSGPARGFVAQGLTRIGVPYAHRYLRRYPDLSMLYQALDVYVVASRQEGGPKAVLESMCSGVPLVTTRVGQAMDMVMHGKNGWMVEVDDAEGLAHWAEYVVTNRGALDNVIEEGFRTASRNSYEAQLPLWREFMTGYVEF